MKIVDANVLAALFLEGGHAQERAHVHFLGGEVLAAPPLWRTEFLSVLRKYVLAGGLDPEAAAIAWWEADAELETLPSSNPEPVLALSLTTDCTVYDCEYVAAALARGVSLVTFDRKLLRAFPSVAREP